MATLSNLIDFLDTKKHEISNLEKEWILFIKDHRQQILENSSIRILTFDEAYMYRYRLNDFLIDNNYNKDIQWVVAWLNNIKSEIDFINIDYLIVPDVAYILSLYSQYRSFMVKVKSTAM